MCQAAPRVTAWVSACHTDTLCNQVMNAEPVSNSPDYILMPIFNSRVGYEPGGAETGTLTERKKYWMRPRPTTPIIVTSIGSSGKETESHLLNVDKI